MQLFDTAETDVNFRQPEVHRPSNASVQGSSRKIEAEHAFQRFHALFNSLFKVLFISPSRYLFAIGLVQISSFRWSIPPILGCNPKQPNSWKVLRLPSSRCHIRGFHPLRRAFPSNLDRVGSGRQHFCRLQFAVAGNQDFEFELFPVHSPLLRESLSVSSPPLNNMLKFSG